MLSCFELNLRLFNYEHDLPKSQLTIESVDFDQDLAFSFLSGLLNQSYASYFAKKASH